MPNDKKTTLQDYIRWLIAQYQVLQQQTQQNAFRIIEHETSRDGQLRLVVQVIGKSVTFKATPHELAADDQLLERFSRQDVRTITYYACNELKKTKARIIFQEFREKINKMIFKIHKPGSVDTIEKTADEISLDKPLLNEMSPEDAHLVGFTSGTEHVIAEKQQLQQIQDN